jgi:hypothetical protein
MLLRVVGNDRKKGLRAMLKMLKMMLKTLNMGEERRGHAVGWRHWIGEIQ